MLMLAGNIHAADEIKTPDAGSGYELRAQGKGFVRLNTETGAMSYCRVVTGNLVCQAGKEEREAYLGSMDSLEERLEAAENRIGRIENGLRDLGAEAREEITPPGQKGDGPQTGESGDMNPPPEESELDRAMDFAERAMRRFFDVVRELREDLESRTQ